MNLQRRAIDLGSYCAGNRQLRLRDRPDSERLVLFQLVLMPVAGADPVRCSNGSGKGLQGGTSRPRSPELFHLPRILLFLAGPSALERGAMKRRRRVRQIFPLEERLNREAQELRQRARKTSPKSGLAATANRTKAVFQPIEFHKTLPFPPGR
jgi:hypothetical protein